MDNKKINVEKSATQRSDVGLNLVGPTSVNLDSEFLRINHELAKKFERLNAGVSE